MKKTALLLLSGIVLGGCAGLMPKPPSPELLAKRRAAIETLYLRVQKPFGATTIWDQADTPLSKQLAEAEAPPMNVRRFGRSVSERMRKIGGAVSAVRVASGPAASDVFTLYLNPTGFLNIRCTGFDYKLEKPTVSANVSNPELDLKIEMHYEATLIPSTTSEILLRMSESVSADTSVADVRDMNPDHFEKLLQILYDEAALQIVGSLQLPQVTDALPALAKPSWFSKKLVVLPFTDSTTNVDAPDLVRAVVQAELVTAGYTVAPLADVDATLKEHGISEGGQLAAVSEKNLLSWLGADLLVSGDIDAFTEKNIGLVHSRTVRGRFQLNSVAWCSNKEVSNSKMAFKKNQMIDNFLGGLLNSWSEKAAKSPLGPETRQFVAESFETLPAQP